MQRIRWLPYRISSRRQTTVMLRVLILRGRGRLIRELGRLLLMLMLLLVLVLLLVLLLLLMLLLVLQVRRGRRLVGVRDRRGGALGSVGLSLGLSWWWLLVHHMGVAPAVCATSPYLNKLQRIRTGCPKNKPISHLLHMPCIKNGDRAPLKKTWENIGKPLTPTLGRVETQTRKVNIG